jgi:predicted nucleic acid-binding Zn ribbon protein
MPTYNFRNKDTGEETELTMSMSELDQYKEDNPHLEQFLTRAPGIARGVGTTRQFDSGFKEVLQKIDERAPGSELKKTSSQL